MSIDRKTFFAYARRAPFGGQLSTAQVAGCNRLLDACQANRITVLAQIGYVLATVFHETGGRMQPVRETNASSDAQAVSRLESAWRKGKLGSVSVPYWRKGFFGRGDVQLTHEENYRAMGAELGIDLVGHPELALDPPISAKICTVGMRDGLFARGHRLGRYFAGAAMDAIGARRIVNGQDKARLIAGYWQNFLDALEAADSATPTPRDVTSEAAEPDDVPPAQSKSLWAVALSTLGGGATTLVAGISNPYALAAFAFLVIAGGIGAYLVMTGRITINRTKALTP